MDLGILTTLIVGFLVIVTGITIAIIQDKRRNLRLARLREKRIVIFEKIKIERRPYFSRVTDGGDAGPC